MSRCPRVFDPEVQASAVRLVTDHAGEYSSLTAALAAVAKRVIKNAATKAKKSAKIAKSKAHYLDDGFKALEKFNKIGDLALVAVPREIRESAGAV